MCFCPQIFHDFPFVQTPLGTAQLKLCFAHAVFVIAIKDGLRANGRVS